MAQAVPETGPTPGEGLGVIFVNYHSEEMILARARDFLDAGFTVVVADNSATFPEVTGIDCVVSGSNLGFGGGCNLAVDRIRGKVDVLCFHNPDVSIAVAGVRELAQTVRAQMRPGAVAPAEDLGGMVRLNGYHYPGVAREYYLVSRRLREAGAGNPHPGAEPHGGAAPHRKRGQGRRFAGASMLLVDAAGFDAVGGFDTRFFMYGEDLDLWHRLGLAGRQLEFQPDVVAEHASAIGSPLSGSLRELYRWIGVELFVYLRQAGWWPSYRYIHQRFLPRYASREPHFVRSLSTMWSAGWDPERVAAGLLQERALSLGK